MKRRKKIVGLLLLLGAIVAAVCGCSDSPQKQTNESVANATTIKAENNTEYIISTAGTYTIEGNAENFTLIVDVSKDDKVELVLNDVSISNDDFPAIYVKSADECLINCIGDNTLTVNNEFKSDGNTNTDAVIFSKDDLIFDGTGQLDISSACGNGISSKNDIKIANGTYTVNCKLDGIEAKESVLIESGVIKLDAASDGIQAATSLTINDGDIEISAQEGLEATNIQINGGNISITASDDGINASEKSDEYEPLIEINGGNITIVMGPGDTDGIDSNGTIVVNGGTIDVTGQSTFDSEKGSTFNGGTIIINGTEVDEIPESMMGGPGRPNEFNGEPGKPNRFDGGEMPERKEFDGEGGMPNRKEFDNEGDFPNRRKFDDEGRIPN